MLFDYFDVLVFLGIIIIVVVVVGKGTGRQRQQALDHIKPT